VLSEDERLPPRYKSRSDQHRVRVEKLSKPKGTYTVVDAQKLLKIERQTSKKKMDVRFCSTTILMLILNIRKQEVDYGV